MKIKASLIASLFLILLVSPAVQSEEEEESQFSLSGSVFTFEGSLANSTSIKVGSMQSSWSNSGEYLVEGITPGENTVRAYFMNDGHTVAYRKMFFDSDTSLDWHEGKNWATFRTQGEYTDGGATTLVELVEKSESIYVQDEMRTFGPYEIGQYYTIRAHFSSGEGADHYIRFKMSSGSSSDPWPNDFDFIHGHNSKYGYLKNSLGTPVEGAMVSAGDIDAITNSDGFFLLQNLEIGTTYTITANQEGVEIAGPVVTEIDSGQGWFNLTSTSVPNFPGPANFTTQITTTQGSPVEINWEGGADTDYFRLYENDEVIYTGGAMSFIFDPSELGTRVFQIESINSNGSFINPKELQIIVLPQQSSPSLWSPGMSWSYYVQSTPEDHQNMTFTAIGSETIEDTFGRERDTYVVRISNGDYGVGEKAFRWVDSNNLLDIKTYWADAPEVSSYYQEGYLGWNFTASGIEAGLFSTNPPTSLHFNRTNFISVPGHPDVYDDTMNVVTIDNDVEIVTGAGTFNTTHISITDADDGIVSWELWYNSTVRNYVRIIDRLPGSHSDSVIYDLTAYDIPSIPRFITEEGKLFNDDEYRIEWTDFRGAINYQLVENGDVVYSGGNTSFGLNKQGDGAYSYRIIATLESGKTVSSSLLNIEVFFVLNAPVFIVPEESPTYISEALAESVSVSWIMLDHYGNGVMEDTCNASGECDSSPDPGVMAEIEWYSVTSETDGQVREVYNGSRANAVLDLEPGQHRLRVKAYSNANGVSSEYSDSVFVIVEESQISFPLSSFGLIISLTLAIMGSIGFFFLPKNTLKARMLSMVKRD
ncbi:MAG: carboxypeptidase-like regulatory domain-containing protein [Candidatus Thalassarchaeaceae archaeon]